MSVAVSKLTVEDGRRLIEASDVLLADGLWKHDLMSVELYGKTPSKLARRYGKMLYAIQATDSGAVKVGVAEKPWERLATLQVGNHERLHGLGMFPCIPSDEAVLHRRFAQSRIRGEWFFPHPALVEFMLFHGATYEFEWDRK